MKRNREDDEEDDAMDVQDAHCAVEEQRRLFEESFKRRRMQDLTLPASETETPPQPLPLSVSSNTFQICSEALVRLLNDLEADPETRNNSRQLLEHVILEREKANKEEPALSPEFVSLWAAGSIWMTRNLLRKNQESLSFPNPSVVIGNAFPLSRIAGLLSKDQSQVATIIPNLIFAIETMTHLSHISEDHRNEILKICSCTRVMHGSLTKAHAFFEEIFELLLQRPELVCDSNTKIRDLQHYTWIFYCYCREILLKDQWESVHDLVLLCYCVTFVGSLVSPAYRRTMSDIFLRVSTRCQREGTELLSALRSSIATDDWLCNFNVIRAVLCVIGGFSLDEYCAQNCNAIMEIVSSLSKNDIFRFEVQLSFQYSIPWPKYTSAFDPERIGLFYCNAEGLLKAYDLLTTQSRREITGRIFRPTSNMKAAPFRINRTPRASIRARQSISARNLKSALDKASLFSHNMPSTPLTARTMSQLAQSRKSGTVTAADTISAQKWIESTFAQISTSSYKHVTPYISQSQKVVPAMESRTNSFTTVLSQKYPAQAQNGKLSVKMYLYLLSAILKQHRIRSANCGLNIQYETILLDGQLHRCLLATCCELVQFASKSVSIKFEEILRLLDARIFEMGMVIELIQNSDVAFPPCLAKRLTELSERILESEIWKTPTVYSLLEKSIDPGYVNNVCVLTELTNFYEVLVAPIDQNGSKQDALQLLLRKVKRLVRVRLRSLCTSLNVPEYISNKTFSLIETCLLVEAKYRLLGNRHIDVIMSCFLFATCRLHDHSLTLQEIGSQYKQQPQYVEATFHAIFMGENEPKMDILRFYNKLFLPVFKSINAISKGEVSEPVPTLARPILLPSIPSRLGETSSASPYRRLAFQNSLKEHQMKPMMETPLKSMMTPTTRKLYNFGEGSNGKAPLSGSPSVNRASRNRLFDFSRPPQGPPPRAPQ